MWRAELACGHHAEIPERGIPPRPGTWITCPDRGCQGQREVTGVTMTALFPAPAHT
jgi:hypothetical protein